MLQSYLSIRIKINHEFDFLYIYSLLHVKKTQRNNKIVKIVYNGGLISKRNLLQPTNGSGWEPSCGINTINAILIIKKENNIKNL